MISQRIITIPISELMNIEVITLRPEETMINAKKIFDANGFHHIPIIEEDGKIAGILSLVDYVRILSSDMIFNKDLNNQLSKLNLDSLQVRDVMQSQVVCVKPTDSLMIAVEIFRANKFHALPVVNEEQKLVGIISTFDLLMYAYCE